MKEITKRKTLNITVAALFTAFIAVMSQISIPIPGSVPITMQTFAVALCGYVLGIKWGFASIITYILLGTVGVPVFAGFKGGPNVIFGYTGGFIFGFIVLVILCASSYYTKKAYIKIILGLAGLIVCHALGVVQFAVVYKTNIIASFLTVSVPYLIKDVISVVLAYFLSIKLIKLLKKSS